MENSTLKIDPAFFSCERCFGLRVRGDLMTGVHIADGDIAIIRPQAQVENNEIAAVVVEDLLTEATLKIVRRTKTTLTLKAANPDYHSLIFRGGGRKRVQLSASIWGWCAGSDREAAPFIGTAGRTAYSLPEQ